jgi:hypothetical protein
VQSFASKKRNAAKHHVCREVSEFMYHLQQFDEGITDFINGQALCSICNINWFMGAFLVQNLHKLLAQWKELVESHPGKAPQGPVTNFAAYCLIQLTFALHK